MRMEVLMSKLDEVLKDVTKEKSDTMEERYTRDIDTWHNNGRYDDILKGVVKRVEKLLDKSKSKFKWIDLGCGPGWIIKSLKLSTTNNIEYTGCDISNVAINYGVREGILSEDSYVDDLNELEFNVGKFYNYDVVSLVDVMYYLGASESSDSTRDWHKSAEAIWSNIKPDTILVVADCLVRFQYRDYFKKLDGCEVLDEYTEYCKPVYYTEKGIRRNLKVKIYRKVK